LVTELATSAVAELQAAIARELEPELLKLAEEMVKYYAVQIPELPMDEDDIRDLLHNSVHANLVTGVDIFAHGIPVEQVMVPAAAEHYTRRLAQRDVPVESLLRAYRLGGSLFLTRWLQELESRGLSPDLLLAAAQHTNVVVTAYIDRISQVLVQIYGEERKSWSHRAAATRVVQVKSVLDDKGGVDTMTAEALTGYRMHGTHLAAVIWSGASDGGRTVESVAQQLGDAVGQQPLAVLVDDHTTWAWVSGPAVSSIDLTGLDDKLRRRRPLVYVAVGNPAVGLAGFRSSHHDALAAQRVAQSRSDNRPGVIAFADVAVSSFLANDLPAARRWVAEVLGGLAVDDEAMAELRRTVLLFLRTGASLTEAAVQLHLHKNTVRYRLRKAEDVRGRAINDRRLDLETGLLACEQLGRSVLVRTRL
jgi:hypothetical protein